MIFVNRLFVGLEIVPSECPVAMKMDCADPRGERLRAQRKRELVLIRDGLFGTMKPWNYTTKAVLRQYYTIPVEKGK
jgi:hypothetical protein